MKKPDSLDRWLDRCEKHANGVLQKHGVLPQWPDYTKLTRRDGNKPHEDDDKEAICTAATTLFWVRVLRETLIDGNTRDAAFQGAQLAQEVHRKDIMIGQKIRHSAPLGGWPDKKPLYQAMVDMVAKENPTWKKTDVLGEAAERLGVTRRTLENNGIRPKTI